VLAVASVLAVPSALPLQRPGEARYAPISEAADPGTAFVAAHRQHEPVVVTSLTTPTRAVSARPDGSLVAELTARPVRVRRGET
jgi:hypothetical protein